MSRPFPDLGEEDLHALVDGELDPQRRERVLADVAASPANWAKLEGWRRQNMLLRAVFAPVIHEALPQRLCFMSRAKFAPVQPAAARAASRRLWPFLAGLALGLCLCLGEALWFAAWPDGGGLAALYGFFKPAATENFDAGAAVAPAAQSKAR